MAAPSPHILGIDPKLYRHFAALTLVISLGIAFLANGEQKRALLSDPRGTAASQPRKAHGPRSEADVLNGAAGDPSPVRMGASPPPPSPAGEDAPVDPAAADDAQFAPKGGHFTYRRPPPRVDPAVLARMTPQQRAAYLKALALRDQQSLTTPGDGPAGNTPSGPSQQQINRLVSASRARSGASE